jgi:hypothetical protein
MKSHKFNFIFALAVERKLYTVSWIALMQIKL